jgi:type IV pilus assembly protein PilQ
MLQSLKPKFTRLFGGFMLTLMAAMPACAGNALTSLDASAGANDSQIVKLTFAEGLDGLPMHFSTANPHRIVLDFPGTDSQLGARAAGAINAGVLGTYRVVKANDRTRVVINLAGPGTYDLRKEGKMLFVSVQSVAKTTGGAVAAPRHLRAYRGGTGAQHPQYRFPARRKWCGSGRGDPVRPQRRHRHQA